ATSVEFVPTAASILQLVAGRGTPGQHLVEDAAERPDVRAFVDRLPARLLRTQRATALRRTERADHSSALGTGCYDGLVMRSLWKLAAPACMIALCVSSVTGAVMLKVGDPAPPFSLPGSDGK